MYLLFQYLVGPHARSRFLRDYVQPASGHRILDLGCGPGLLYRELQKLKYGEVDYLGLDIDSKYIASAQRRMGHELFREADVCQTAPSGFGLYDRIMAYGLLHHLDDEQVGNFFAFARSVLKPGGRVVTLDGTLVAQQNRIARIIIALDRGQNIRAPEHYRYLAQPHFARVALHVRHDLQTVPYSCAVLVSDSETPEALRPGL